MSAFNDDFLLPEDADLAFLQLEREFRTGFERDSEERMSTEYFAYLAERYFRATMAAAHELSIDIESPPFSSNDPWSSVRALNTAVDSYRVRIRIRKSRAFSKYSVRLSSDRRSKISAIVERLRHEVRDLDLSDEKKDRLQKLLSSFQLEIERTRTKMEAVGDFARGVAGVVADVDDKIGWRVYKWVMLMLGQVDAAKREEPQLPAPHDPRRLPAPEKTE